MLDHPSFLISSEPVFLDVTFGTLFSNTDIPTVWSRTWIDRTNRGQLSIMYKLAIASIFATMRGTEKSAYLSVMILLRTLANWGTRAITFATWGTLAITFATWGTFGIAFAT